MFTSHFNKEERLSIKKRATVALNGKLIFDNYFNHIVAQDGYQSRQSSTSDKFLASVVSLLESRLHLQHYKYAYKA